MKSLQARLLTLSGRETRRKEFVEDDDIDAFYKDIISKETDDLTVSAGFLYSDVIN